jgi:TatA/E family protein of Tat protein translocase
MLGTIGGPELFLILVIALIVFGPKKLPEIGRSLGRMMIEFKKATSEFQATVEREIESDKLRSFMEDPLKAEEPKKAALPEEASAPKAALPPTEPQAPQEPTVSRAPESPVEPK